MSICFSQKSRQQKDSRSSDQQHTNTQTNSRKKGRHSDKTLVRFRFSYSRTRLHSLYGTVAAIFAHCRIREQAVVVATIVAVIAAVVLRRSVVMVLVLVTVVKAPKHSSRINEDDRECC